MTMTPEMKSEFLTMLRAELERQEREKKQSRSAYQRICKDFEEDFAAFDRVTEHRYMDVDGKTRQYRYEHTMRWKIRDAIGVLLRAAYGVDAVAKLPAEKEAEMREMVSAVLGIMEKHRAKP